MPGSVKLKSVLLAYLLWLVFGLVGGHRFYLGWVRTGLAQAALIVSGLVLPMDRGGGYLLSALFAWLCLDLVLIPRMARLFNERVVSGQASVSADEGDLNRSPPSFVGKVTRSVLPTFPSSSLGSRFEMDYADTDGVVTSRVFDLLSVTLDRGALYVNAFCHLRGGERTFRADRIIALKRVEGAGIVPDPEVFLLEFLPESARPDPAHDGVIERVRNSLSALIWIASADREISIEEMDVLLEFISARNGLGGAKYSAVMWNREKAAAWIDAARPTFATSISAISRMSRTGREYQMVGAYASKLALIGGGSAENRRHQLFR